MSDPDLTEHLHHRIRQTEAERDALAAELATLREERDRLQAEEALRTTEAALDATEVERDEARAERDRALTQLADARQAAVALGQWGYADPLYGLFEDGVGVQNYACPWWVPLAPLGPITDCQAWAAFLRWWCEPKWHRDSPRVERHNSLISDVTWEFREDAEHPVLLLSPAVPEPEEPTT